MNEAGNDSFNTSFGLDESGIWSGENTKVGWSDGDKWVDDTQLLPIKGTKKFPPLSLRPIALGQTMPSVSLADRYTLEKQTPAPPGQEDHAVEKDWNTLLPESLKMTNSEIQRLEHTHAISTELKLLLENEKKILNQLTKRCNKFTELKDENKRKTDVWYSENKRRLSRYESNLGKLSNHPDDLDVDGIHAQVQQKILLELVHKTAEAASDISVQLSIEETIINDVDLSLTGLKKHSAVMLRQIADWTKSLSVIDRTEAELMDRWEVMKEGLEELTEKEKEKERERNKLASGSSEISSKQLQSIVKEYDTRIRKLEEQTNIKNYL